MDDLERELTLWGERVREWSVARDSVEPPRAEEIIVRAEARRGGGEIARSASVTGGRFRMASALLLAASVAALAWTMALRVGGGADPSGRSMVAEEFTTGAGESTAVRLSDGSVIRLGPESRLTVGSGSGGRQVALEGRAFFAIAHDEERPFRVILPTGSVRVLGTRFHLDADLSDTRLIVVEGSVAIADPAGEVRVSEGQMMTRLERGEAKVEEAPPLENSTAAWMGKYVIFQDTPLRKVADEVAALHGVEFRIEDPELEGRTVTMWLADRPIEELLTVLCSVIDARCTVEDGTVTVGRASRF